MKSIETSIHVQAAPERVWQVLMDFDRHPEWNPFIVEIKGVQRVGEQLSVTMKPPGSGKGMTFRPTIVKIDPRNEFRWLGKLGLSSLFSGEHYFLLRPDGPNSTTFVHGEKFGGILVPMLGGMLKKTKEGFELMNEALKKECELNG